MGKLIETTDYISQYITKKATIDSCLGLIHSHDVVGVSGDCNEPVGLLRRLHTIADRVEDVVVFKGRIGTYDFVHSEGMRDRINTAGFFYGPGWYEGHRLKNVSFVPADLCDYRIHCGRLAHG